jgi:hypothetical protein
MITRAAQACPGGPWRPQWHLADSDYAETTRRRRGDRPRRVTQALGSGPEPRWVTQIPDRSYVSKSQYKRCIPATIDDLNYAHIVTYASENRPFCML